MVISTFEVKVDADAYDELIGALEDMRDRGLDVNWEETSQIVT